MTRNDLILPMVLVLSLASLARSIAQDAEKIWDAAPHSAFTDLIDWNEKLYCAFRIGNGHVPRKAGDEGRIQIIASADNGKSWKDVATLDEPGIDLRDPKLSITPDGRLMILFAGSNYDGSTLKRRDCRVVFVDSVGKSTRPEVIDFNSPLEGSFDWLWRVTWNYKTGYGVIYQPDKEQWGLHLVRTRDGVVYELVKSFDLPGKPNEATIRFREVTPTTWPFDPWDQMLILVRNEAGVGHLGQSGEEFSEWQWTDVDTRLGGPNMVRLPDGRWLMSTREYGEETRTVYGILADSGKFQKLGTLPSGGDTSYPGIVLTEDEALISYYSSHEGKTAIYLARIKLDDVLNAQ